MPANAGVSTAILSDLERSQLVAAVHGSRWGRERVNDRQSMKKKHAGVIGDKRRIEQAEARTEQAEARTEQAETRTEQAKTRAESAETRTEQAESRTELAKTRAEQAETRTEQAETILRHVVRKEGPLRPEISTRSIKRLPLNALADQKSPLETLTSRQREILRLIAQGQNTKQIAEILKVSPKTIEYHRMKLMAALDVHDIPGLVRLAVRAGLIPPES